MNGLSDQIRRHLRHHVGDAVPNLTAQIVADGIATGLLADAADIPYPVASVVTVDGGRYLVSEISYGNCGRQPANYGLIGHPDLGTGATRRAWFAHANLAIDTLPDPRTWALLKEAVRLDLESRIMTVVPSHG